jgi:hypothetical protein
MVGGIDFAPNTQYQIDINANISGLSADLPTINLGSGDSPDIHGDNYTQDAGGMDRGLFVQAGSVQIFLNVGTTVAALDFGAGNAEVDDPFHITPDSGTGIEITDDVPCFCRGTRILTTRGEVAVEDRR